MSTSERSKELLRCPWCGQDSLYMAYHDNEWGVPVHDEITHFEFLLLEGFQAGLSWLTILRKRENFRAAFDGFDPRKIAGYGEAKITELLGNAGIVRNRRKVRSAVTNAQAFLRIQEEYGSFDAFIWRFVDGTPIQNEFGTLEEVPATTPLSDKLSKELKSRGFSFVGSTIVYAHMQAIGMVNDHLLSCFRHAELNR